MPNPLMGDAVVILVLVVILVVIVMLSFALMLIMRRSSALHCTMCILGSTMALWSKAEIQKYTY